MDAKISYRSGGRLFIKILAPIAIFITLLIFFEPENEAIIRAGSFFMVSMTALVFLYSCVLMWETNQLTQERNERYYSIDIIREFRSKEMRAMRAEIWGKCINKKCEKPSQCRAATEMFNFFEMLSLSYYTGHASKAILKEAFQDVFNEWYDQCEDWLIKQSEIAKDKNRERQKHITALRRDWKK